MRFTEDCKSTRMVEELTLPASKVTWTAGERPKDVAVQVPVPSKLCSGGWPVVAEGAD